MENKKEQGKRYNEGKTRHDLVPEFPQEQYARVLTAGANKYGDSNWRKGMEWTKVLASLKRHILAFERGEDFDLETGEYHMAHAMCNCAFLLEYYKTHPEYDNRTHQYLNTPKIGLDIDEVLADWVGSWCEKFGFKERPIFWQFDYEMSEHWNDVAHDKDFWLNVKRKIEPSELNFEPHCYITSRSIPIEWTREWLKLNGFPCVPLYQITNNTSKVEIAKKSGCDLFIDDKFENFTELNNAGICCFLMDAPHNQRYNVGYKRVFNVNDVWITNHK